jgi:hypothetical protein
METENLTIVSKESIKLIKLSKGYNWEIKIIGSEDGKFTVADFEKLKKINEELVREYGSV